MRSPAPPAALPAPDAGRARVRVRGLRKRYGTIEALRGLDLDVGPGEIVGLLGPNGAGKTTALECLAGLREADEGELEIGGRDIRAAARDTKEHLGVVLQSPSLPERLTPREALELFAAFYRTRVEGETLVARFGLEAFSDRPCGLLSGGQRQRLSLALASVNNAEVLLLDEPTAGLDPEARRGLHDELRRLRGEGRALLLATHDLAETEALCDRIVIVSRGRVVASGTPAELRSGAEGWTVTLVTRGWLPEDVVAGLPGAEAVERTEAGLRFRTRAATTLAAAVTLAETRGGGLVALDVREASLEDVYLGAVGGEGER
jgi:ABC-2 type transport system ATP-binding protein